MGMKPGKAEVRVENALRFEREGLLQRAEREYRSALEAAPRHLIALNNLGTLYASRRRFTEAAQMFRRALAAHPEDLPSNINLAGVLRELGQEAQAVQAFERALALDPGSRMARINLANLLRSMGRLTEARPHYQTLLKADAEDGLARWNLAALEGLSGDLRAAFSGFAAHHEREPVAAPPPLPRWRGEPLAGRSILLISHQGFGDTIMFARFADRLTRLGARVVLWAQPPLQPLLRRLAGVDLFEPVKTPLSGIDVWHPLEDLPAVLEVGSTDLLWPGAYLSASSEKQADWSARLARQPGKLRVGLVWAGNPTHPDDHNRSIPLPALVTALSAVSGIHLVSLQKGPRSEEAGAVGIERIDQALEDFEDTAGAIANLDLVITVDTSVLHLTGAMGREAWGLVPYAPDWRWMLGRDDSPWYPTVRLFRQTQPRSWVEPLEAVVSALEKKASREAAPDRLASGG